jgi:hypothetical protein
MNRKMIYKKFTKKAQEELVGFALIVIIVSVILLFLLSFSLRDDQRESVQNYEVDGFIQSFLQYTTDCEDNLEHLSVQDLIFECDDQATCLDGREACDVLDSTLKEIASESWKTGQDRPVKGYELLISVNEQELLTIKEGNITNSYKGSLQDFTKGSDSIKVSFRVYD